MEDIPIVIICYNNYKFVEMMIKQIENINKNQKIIIINNNSNCKYTKIYLNELNGINKNIIHYSTNVGHDVWQNKDIYDCLPNRFIITDPDLKFNEKLPNNYIDILIELSEKYKTERIGFALDISDKDKMFPYKFSDFNSEWSHITTIWDSQQQYWNHKIDNSEYELYYSPIDTTFCLFTKSQKGGISIRIAGNFTCKHLPWYKDIDGLSRYQRYMIYKDSSSSSSIRYFEMQYIKDSKLSLVKKHDEHFLISEDYYNDFWSDNYLNWEPDLFYILDKYLQKDKQFLDISYYNYMSSLYATRLSSYVVCIEPNKDDYKMINDLFQLNYIDTKLDIEYSIIYDCDNIKIKSVNTIKLETVIKKYKLDNLSLINVNIQGNEEFILSDLYNYCFKNKVNFLVKFKYDEWNDKNINRFTFLNDYEKNKIINNPNCYVFFNYNT